MSQAMMKGGPHEGRIILYANGPVVQLVNEVDDNCGLAAESKCDVYKPLQVSTYRFHRNDGGMLIYVYEGVLK